MTKLQKCAAVRLATKEYGAIFKDAVHALQLCNNNVEHAIIFLAKCYYWENSQMAMGDRSTKRSWCLQQAKDEFNERKRKRQEQRDKERRTDSSDAHSEQQLASVAAGSDAS